MEELQFGKCILKEAAGQSLVGSAVFMGKECQEDKVLPESKLYRYWPDDGERFFVAVHWSGDKNRSSVNQALAGNQFQFCSVFPRARA